MLRPEKDTVAQHEGVSMVSSRYARASAQLTTRGVVANFQIPANDRIRVGIIGLGSRGFNLLDEFLNEPRVQIVALCDVHDFHYRDRPWGQGPVYGRIPARKKVESHVAADRKSGTVPGLMLTSDFRYLCDRDDLDVLVVATPDHWHALCTQHGIASGKDIYCEKPVTHLFAEGQQIASAVQRHQTVFQTGSQQRSDPLFQHAVNLVRNGVLGGLERIEVGLPAGYDKPQLSPQVTAPPVGLDYEMWCGPAPRLPYSRAWHHRWWRGVRAYGGGVLMDWIGHHNDIAHWSLDLDQSGPKRVEAVDWTFPDTDAYDTPHHYTIRCEYENGAESTISSRNLMGTKWFGTNGWLHVTRGKLTASDEAWTKLDFDSGPQRVQAVQSHVTNFIDCVISREQPIAPAAAAHRSITPGHLGYVSQALSRPLQWDPVSERVIGDDEAQSLLMQAEYRAPWSMAAFRNG